MVLAGVIEITLTDGKKEQHLDLLGRGSIIGMSNVLNGDKWPFHATARTTDLTSILWLSNESLLKMTKTHKKLRKSLEKGAKITQDVMAISYIDYVCCYEKLNFDVQGQHKTYSSRF